MTPGLFNNAIKRVLPRLCRAYIFHLLSSGQFFNITRLHGVFTNLSHHRFHMARASYLHILIGFDRLICFRHRSIIQKLYCRLFQLLAKRWRPFSKRNGIHIQFPPQTGERVNGGTLLALHRDTQRGTSYVNEIQEAPPRTCRSCVQSSSAVKGRLAQSSHRRLEPFIQASAIF